MKHYLKLDKDKFLHSLKSSDLKTSIKCSLPKWRGSDLELFDEHKNEYFIHICGKITDKTVLDFDSEESYLLYIKELKKRGLSLSDVPVYKTGKGYQVFYRYIPNLKTTVAKTIDMPIDVRNDNSLSFAHSSLFEFGYYSDFNDVPIEERRHITQDELDVFLDITDLSTDKKISTSTNGQSYTLKTSEYFYRLVSDSVSSGYIDEQRLLLELEKTRPFEFSKIPTKEGEGRNNFLTIFKGKCLRHIKISASMGAKFLKLLNDSYLHLPAEEMHAFSEEYLRKSPLYIDPTNYEENINSTYNFSKKFYGVCPENPIKKTWVKVEVFSEYDIKMTYYETKETFTIAISRDLDYKNYYINEKDKLIIDNLQEVRVSDDYTSRQPYYRKEDVFYVNTAAIDYTKHYINYSKYCENYSSYNKPSSFIALMQNLIPEEYLRNYFLNSLHLFLKEGKSCMTYPVFIDSKGGTGKSLLMNIINSMIYKSKELTEISSITLSETRFNGPYVTSKLLVINESGDTLTQAKSKALTEKLKSLVANKQTSCEFKGKDIQSVVVSRFVMQTTNNSEDIYIDLYNSRRQYILQTSETRLSECSAVKALPFTRMEDFINDIYDRTADIIAYLEDLYIQTKFTYEDYCIAPDSLAKRELTMQNPNEALTDISELFTTNGEVDIEAVNELKLEESDTTKRRLIDYIEAEVIKQGLLREIRFRKVLKEAYPNIYRNQATEVIKYFKKYFHCTNPDKIRHKIFSVKLK